MGTPKYINLYRKATIVSVDILRETNSDLKLEASTVFWSILYQTIGALFS